MEKREKKRLWVLSCPIDNLSLEESISAIEGFIKDGHPHQYVGINADVIVRIQRDPLFRRVILNSDLNIVDGQPLVWVSKLFGQPVRERYGGIDIMNLLIPLAEKKGYGIYFLGAQKEVIKKVIEIYRGRYPDLKITGWRDGYWKPEEERDVVENIKKSCSDILFFAMSSSKKEIFPQKYLYEMNIPFVMGVGGAFDIIAGKTKRAPKWMQQLGLEWFFRLIQEPRRLWRRYLIGNPIFIYLVVKELLKKRCKETI